MIDEIINELIEKGVISKDGKKPRVAKKSGYKVKDKRRYDKNGKKRIFNENEKKN